MNTFYHSGDIGDVVFGLPAIRALGGGKLSLGHDLNKIRAMALPRPRAGILKDTYDFMEPLLSKLPYIHQLEYSPTSGEEYTLNFDSFRTPFVEKNGRGINLAHAQLDLAGAPRSALDTPWLNEIPPGKRMADVVFARSSRAYTYDSAFPYEKFVKEYATQAVFIGLPAEYMDFIARFGNVRYRPIKDMLEMTQLIQQASLFIGNTSCPHAIAEGLHKDTIIEMRPNTRHAYFERPNAKFFHLGSIVSSLPEVTEHKIIHMVSRYKPEDSSTIRRINVAAQSWKTALYEKGVHPVYMWENDCDRDSTSIGDHRKCAFLKDILARAMYVCEDGDDLIIMTNDDTILHPDVLEFIKRRIYIQGKPCCCSFRYDLYGEVTLQNAFDNSLRMIQSPGRDLFACKKKWLEENLHLIPDYTLGSTDWDYFLGILMRKSMGGQINMTDVVIVDTASDLPMGYVFHEAHQAWWKLPENQYAAPSQKHNKKLTYEHLCHLGYRDRLWGARYGDVASCYA